VPVHAAVLPLAGAEHLFSVRCCDEHSRWTGWSAPSEPVGILAPSLVPPGASQPNGKVPPAGVPSAIPENCPDHENSFLRVTPMGDHAAVLEWGQFQCAAGTFGGVLPARGIDAALQRVAYRLRMSRRLSETTGAWSSLPLAELVSERHLAGHLSHEIADLDERYEYLFHVSARWLDVPTVLGSQTWTEEISSNILMSRLRDLSSPDRLCADVQASDSEGLSVHVRWRPCLALRDSAGSPIPGSRYQVCHARVPFGDGEDSGCKGSARFTCSFDWQMLQPVLEDGMQAARHEVISKVWGLEPGSSYCFRVRVGDAHRWSDWSHHSEAIQVAVAAPLPSPGDVLEIACGRRGADSVSLEWQPFRTLPGLKHLEYKVMALECSQETPAAATEGEGVLARMRRAADATARGDALPCTHLQHTTKPNTFRAVGYITAQRDTDANGLSLRSQGNRLEWLSEGLRPGMSYRFFICARYSSLLPGAVAMAPSRRSSESPVCSVSWPHEHFDWLRSDSVAWETALSHVGLWSSVVSTVHLPQYAVRPMPSLGCPPGGPLAPNVVLGPPGGGLPHAVEDSQQLEARDGRYRERWLPS